MLCLMGELVGYSDEGEIIGSDTWANFTLKDVTEAHLDLNKDILYVLTDIGEVAILCSSVQCGMIPPSPGYKRVGRGYVQRTERK